MRLKIIRLIISGLFLLIAFNLTYIQLIRGAYFFRLSKDNRIRVVPLEGIRGRILDRNGTALAFNRLSFEVVIIPQEIKDEEETFIFLSRVLGINKERLFKRYEHRKFTPFSPVMVADDVAREVAFAIEENKYRFPGVLIQEGFKRVYPYRAKTAHVIGYVGKLNRSKLEQWKDYGYTSQTLVGYSGVEEYYDTYLRGETGGLQIEVNSRGHQVRILGIKEPLEGQDITLTVDHRLQEIAAELLQDKVGSIIVMNMDNGEILGMTSSPSYDPNIFTNNDQSAARPSKDSSPFLNRAINGQFPPGSVFKIPVALCALELGRITEHTTFLCRGFYDLGDVRFGCTHEHGIQDLHAAITHSCNVYFYHLGLLLGIENLKEYMDSLALGRRTNIDLPSEMSGFIPGPGHRKISSQRGWYKGDTLNFSIGQGDLLTTPLQLATMIAAIGTGWEVQPHLIKSINAAVIDRYSFPRKINASEKNLEILREGLRAVVTQPSGTANVLNIPDLFVAGKTGTAQTSGEKEHHAWFVGYSVFPNKKIAFCVFLEHGGSSYNACEMARELLLRIKEGELL